MPEKPPRVPAAPPQRSGEFAHLPLAGLRQYRKALSEEESRVSYWRRIIQARLDMVSAPDGPSPDVEGLRPMLAEPRVTSGRRALIEVMPVGDIPPLPNLEQLWDRDPRPDDPAYNADLIEELRRAESQLSAYRSALHQRLAQATGELIARYREDPLLCLSALPLPPQRNATADAARGA